MKIESLRFDERYMSKIWKYNRSFKKSIKKLEKQNKYTFHLFKKDVETFLKDELNSKFRKHKLSGFDNVFSITLWYDLRALYFFIRKKDNGDIEYLFFDIWDHDDVY